MKIAKAVGAVTAAMAVLLAGSGSASAETLYRNGAKKVVVMPAPAPASLVMESATVTVKKGKKTVARNVPSYSAKKGKYRVTTNFAFRTAQQTPALASDVGLAECRIATRSITSDRTTLNDFGLATVWYSGQATVRYTGTCVDDIYNAVGSQRHSWEATWQDDEYLMTAQAPRESDWVDLKLAALDQKEGDVDYVFAADLSALPTLTTYSGVQYSSTTRTVRVK